MSRYYKVTDVKLDGKPTARTLYRVEDLTDTLDVNEYKTIKPKHKPSAQEIQWLENNLGFKLSSEYKEFIVNRGAVQYGEFQTIGIPKSGNGENDLSINSIMDDIEEFTDRKSTKIPKDAVPLIYRGSSGITMYLNHSKKIGYWKSGPGYLGEGSATTIDEAIIEALLE